MSDEENFARHRIDETGISVEFFYGWPVESIIKDRSGIIYQRIEDTDGLVFVRYGQDESIPEFLTTLTDLITTVSVTKDEVTSLGKVSGRHITLTQKRSSIGVHRPDDQFGFVHEQFGEVQNFISVFSFSHQGIPILVGYRIPEASLASYSSIVERIIQSIDTHSNEQS